ncbi:MAG: hypothetical protein AAF721_04035 [Myxococcota bacterium]
MAGCAEDLAPEHRAAYEVYVEAACECTKILGEIPTEVDASGVESVDIEQAKEVARKARGCQADAAHRHTEAVKQHSYSQGLTEEAHVELDAFEKAVGRCLEDVNHYLRLR